MKIIHLFVLILFGFLFSNQSYSQSPTWQWFKNGGGSGSINTNGFYQQTKQIGTDANGNIYGISPVTSFSFAIDTLSPQSGFGYDDFVVFSLTCQGKLRWVKKFGSAINDNPTGLLVDNQGNVFVSGIVRKSFYDAHFGDSIIPANSYVSNSYFIVKLDSLGNIVFLKFPGQFTQNNYTIPISMEADKNGNPTVLTWFGDTVSWNGFQIPRKGHYIVKYDKNNGNIVDFVELGFKFSNNDLNKDGIFYTIDTDNRIYLCSKLPCEKLYIGNDTLTIKVDTTGLSFLAKFESNGNVIWHSDILSSNNTNNFQYILGKPIIINGKIHVLGGTFSFSGSNFLGSPIVNSLADNNYIYTRLIASFSKNDGSFKAVNYLQSKYNIMYVSMKKMNNNLILAGSSGTIIVMNQNDTIKPFTTGNENYPFIVQVDTGLTHFDWGIATKTLQGNVIANISCLHVDHNGNILLGGKINGAITNTAGDTFNLVGYSDNFFIAKVALTNDSCGCNKPITSLNIVSSAGKTLFVKGNATNMPDSVFVNWGDGVSTNYYNLNAIINHTYTNLGPWNVTLNAYSYCGNSTSILSNLYSGVSSSTINSLEISIFPNPFTNSFSIELSQESLNTEVLIYDLIGKKVFNTHFDGKSISINAAEFPSGIYFVKLISQDGKSVMKKIVKN